MKLSVLACALFGSSCALGAEYFPLEPGNRWSYVWGEAGSGPAVTVLSREGDSFLVDFSGQRYRLRKQWLAGPIEAVDIELPGEGFVPFYRFGADSFTHRDPFVCDDERDLVVGSKSETVTTPAGTFGGCLRLDYRGNRCFDAGTISEWWCPEVGLVAWTESWIGGVRKYELSSLERQGTRQKFLRGDADGNSKPEITDAIFLLNHLFLGGARPPCEDAADSNDDGALDISDAVYLLLYLFAGGKPPPFPGAETAGFDATTDDPFSCGDFWLPAPEPRAESTLPGASFDLSGNPPAITLEQAARGVAFVYRTVLAEDLRGVTASPLDGGRCDRPDASGLAVLEVISGDGQTYCLCDVGRCAPHEEALDLRAGVYEAVFEWDGRNWHGPSDTSNPKGDPFPPGKYELRLRAAGTYRASEGSELPYEVLGTLEFYLVP